MAMIKPILTSLFGLACFLLVWELAVLIFKIPEYTLPGLGAVATAIVDEWALLFRATFVTSSEVVISFLISITVAICIAVALHWWPVLAKVVWPIVLFIKLTPQVALAPVLIVWLGLGMGTKVALAVFIAFFPALVGAYVGLQSLEPDVKELARSMKLSRLETLIHFELPAALPHIFSGAKVAVASSLIGTLVAEFMGSNEGLGHVLLLAIGAIETPLAMAIVLILGIVGSLLYWMVALTESHFVGWHISQRRA